MSKEQLAQWLVELDENVLQVAVMYAENYLKYGVDVAEKWNTATKQQWSLKEAERYGFAEGRKSIVRCKDCVFWQDNNDGYPHHDCKWREDETPDPDDYCSAGERKKGR